MTIPNKRILELQDIKKLIKKGEKSFQGKTKKYPLIDNKGNYLVVKIELKEDSPSGLYAVIHTAAGNTQKDYCKKEFAKRQVLKYRELNKLKVPKFKDPELKLILNIGVLTGIRPGGQSDKSMGLLDLKVSNIKVSKKAGVILEFIGKARVNQVLLLSKNIGEELLKFTKNKKPTDKIFTYTPGKLNGSLGKFSFKKLRTMIANDIADTYLSILKNYPTTKKDYKLCVTEMCGKVAEQLGHKKGNGDLNVATSRKSYVAPDRFQELARDVEEPVKLLTKKEREIAEKGSMWEKALLPIRI